MNSALLQCPKCRGPLLEGVFNRQDPAPCPNCRTPVQVEVFPAFFRKIDSGPGAEAVMVEGESSCFYHPQKKAIIPCAACGRFLCALCDCELNGQHLCPVCLDTGRTKGKIKGLQNRRTLHGDVALALAFYPLIIPYLTFITAPMALYVAIRHWNSAQSLVRPRTKARCLLAIVVASIQILGWIILILFIFNRRSHG